MILVTYNLRAGGAGRSHWSKVLDELQPDLFLVQETTAPDTHLPPSRLTKLSRRIAWTPVNGRRWGSAIYASHGSARQIELPDFHGHVVGLDIGRVKRPDRCREKLMVYSVHAPFRGSYPRAMNEILDMIAAAAVGADVVIGGDFNISTSERHHSEERITPKADLAIQRRLKEEFGLMNCWQSANRNVPLAQTLRWTNAPKTPYHCDGLFVPISWLPSLSRCAALSSAEWNLLSDHSPIVAEFERG
jgi:exonuclease III